jgi:ribokinase
VEAAGVECRGILDSGRPSGTAVIGVDRHGENQIIVASGANLDVDAGQVTDGDLAADVTLLCQNEVRPESTFALIAKAKTKGARTVLNLAPAGAVPAAVLDALDILVVNQIEAAAAAGVGGGDPVALAQDLARRHRLACIVTLGARGAIAVTPAGGWRVGALPVEPLDTTGAGDAFTGVLAAALDLGQPLPLALRRASVAAGLTCRDLGAQTAQPTAAAIEAHLAELAEPVPLA